MREKQPLLNTRVNDLSCREAAEVIEGMIREGKKGYVVEVNADVVMQMEKDAELRRISEEADLTLTDGTPLVWISRLTGHPVRERASGSDLALLLCQGSAEKGYSLFILGGGPGVAERARANLEERYPGVRVAGVYAPPLGFEEDEAEAEKVCRTVSAAKPDAVLVCLGCPKQEKWIARNMQKVDAKVFLCAGATVDFMAGTVKRAPRWMRKAGLEWFYRFLKEPRRLFKRYFIDDMKVFRLMFKYR